MQEKKSIEIFLQYIALYTKSGKPRLEPVNLRQILYNPHELSVSFKPPINMVQWIIYMA